MKNFYHMSFAALVALCLSAMTACGVNKSEDGDWVSASSHDITSEDSTVFIPELWPQRTLSPPRDEDIEQRIEKLLVQMSIEEKVGQVIQAELRHVTPDDVRRYHLGSILNGGGTTPHNDKYASVDDWANLAEEFYQASMDTSDGKIAIPVIWGSDSVHGNNNVYGATVFPHNIGLGAANDPELIQRIGEITALETAATGVSWTFGPTVAVATDIRWGRTYESYSERPELVASYSTAMVRGIQGSSQPGAFDPDTVVATAKHFLGDGGTQGGIDRGDTLISEKELMEVHSAGYFSALDANVHTVMASFNSWNGHRVHGHKYLLTEILKGRLGFDGFVVSDWNGHRHVEGCTVERCPHAINAGIDLVMVTEDWEAFYHNLLKDVQSGAVSMARLDDAVSRILRVKLRRGLFDAGPILERKNVGEESLLGSTEHREVARDAVRKSLVLLKNNSNILPVSPSANILVVGEGADNISKQTGGWTLTWQGTGNTNEDFPGGSSVYDGISSAVESAGGTSVLSTDGEWDNNAFPEGAAPDVAIVVYGEEPYAEWHGDIPHIEYQQGAKKDLELLKSLRAQGIPVVSVFLSGRPLWVNMELNASDAFVAAWLPGSEGRGIADVLLAKPDGEVNYDFQGRLSFSWPRYVTQTGVDTYKGQNSPLFPYGYGLTYDDQTEIANNLNEDGIDPNYGDLEESWLFVSRERSPWSFYLQDLGSEPVLVTGNSATSGDINNLLFHSVDRSTQEDARRLVWAGHQASEVSLVAGTNQDFSDYFEEGSVLTFLLKVDQYPTQEVDLSLNCEEGCSGIVSLAEMMKSQELSVWNDIFVDLNCFAADKSDLENLTEMFVLGTEGTLDISLSDIKVLPEKAPGEQLANALTCDQLVSSTL